MKAPRLVLQATALLAVVCAVMFAQNSTVPPDLTRALVQAKKVNLAWWDCLEQVYEREKVVWHLFVGSQPTPEQNKLYAKFRTMLLKGSGLKANA